MMLEELQLAEIVSMVQVFRVETNRWPSHAAELQAFAGQWQKPLDFSRFHTLVFQAEDHRTLTMEFSIQRFKNELASCGRLQLRRVAQSDQETTFGWRMRYLPLPPKKVVTHRYCLVR
jgi:hypothetical protein